MNNWKCTIKPILGMFENRGHGSLLNLINNIYLHSILPIISVDMLATFISVSEREQILNVLREIDVSEHFAVSVK